MRPGLQSPPVNGARHTDEQHVRGGRMNEIHMRQGGDSVSQPFGFLVGMGRQP